MTTQTKATLQGYFNTGDVPSEANFADLIDTAIVSDDVRAGLAAASAPSGANPFVTANGQPRITLGTKGATDGEWILASANRENYGATISQQDFGGHPDPVMWLGYNSKYMTGYSAAEQSIVTGYEGYYWVDAGHQYVEWYVDWRTPNGALTGRTFQTSVELNTGSVYAHIHADNLVIANGAGNVNYWQILSGVASFSMPVGIGGVSDTIQLIAKGYSTQINPILQVQDNAGNGLFSVYDHGAITTLATAPATAQTWMFDESTGGTTSTYIYGHRISVFRDNGGSGFNFTNGLSVTAGLRAQSANAYSRYISVAQFQLYAEAYNGRQTLCDTGPATIIDVSFVKSGAGTNLMTGPYGVRIGDMGGAGSYSPAAIYIAAQTAATSGANYAIDSQGGRVRLLSLPTSAAGLASGELWNNGGVINIVA